MKHHRMMSPSKEEKEEEGMNDNDNMLLHIKQLAEQERREQRSVEQRYTQEQMDEKLVTAWFSGFIAAEQVTDEEKTQLKEQGLLMK